MDSKGPTSGHVNSGWGMAGLNFSISDEPRLLVEFEGWPLNAKTQMQERVLEIEGVLNVTQAGGGIGLYVYYDKYVIEAVRLTASLRETAKELMPGRSF